MISLPLMVGAFVAGVFMFLAPCTLPIVPGYLAFIGGNQKLVLRNAVAFVLGFSVIFVLLGVSFSLFGIAVGPWRFVLGRIGGALIILFGLTMLGVFRIPLLSGERHITLPQFITVGHPASSLLIGGLFALGWSPCVGPILGSILTLALSVETVKVLSGALLLGIFSLGFAVPFLLSALLLSHVQGFFLRIARAAEIASMIGGVFLVLFGVLMLFDQTALLISWGYGALNFIGYDKLVNHL